MGLMYTNRFTLGGYGCFSAVFERFIYQNVGRYFLALSNYKSIFAY